MSNEFDEVKKSYKKLQLQEMMEGISALATVLFVYYQELVKQGFSEAEAMYLTAQYQNTLISPKNKTSDSNG